MHRRNQNQITTMEVTQMNQDEKIKEAQQLLDWVTMHLNFKIKCKVIDYKRENYRVHIHKEDKLVMPIQVAEQDLKEINLNDNFIPDKLKTLLTNLERY